MLLLLIYSMPNILRKTYILCIRKDSIMTQLDRRINILSNLNNETNLVEAIERLTKSKHCEILQGI